MVGRPDWLTLPRGGALALSLSVLALAWIPEFDLGGSIDRDLAILTLTLVGLIWSACFAYEAVHEPLNRANQEKAEHRRMVATALLTELRMIEGMLRVTVDHGPVADSVNTKVLDRTLAEPELFSSTTVQHLVTFANRLQLTLAAIPKAAEAKKDAAEQGTPDRSRVDALDHLVRAAAHNTVKACVDLARSLEEDEGGTIPQGPTVRIRPGDTIPPLPESKFGKWDARAGWS